MKVITQLDLFSKEAHQPIALALGNFDGVHLGHQEIFRLVSENAKAINGLAAVFTFTNHPQRVLRKSDKALLLTSFYQKLSLLSEAGIDLCFVLEFTNEFSKKLPEEFVKEVLIEQLGAKVICMGFNARFGWNRSGDSNLMRSLSKPLGFEFFEAGAVQIGTSVVSSSAIRKSIEEGDLKQASCMLGRSYSFYGTVVKGSGRGTNLGFPTANLTPHSEVLPPYGVYAVLVNLIDDHVNETKLGFEHSKRVIVRRVPAVMNYGIRPTFENESEVKPVIEVHLLSYSGNFLGKTLEVEMVKKIRDEKRFRNKELLIQQIERDIACAREQFFHSPEKTNRQFQSKKVSLQQSMF